MKKANIALCAVTASVSLYVLLHAAGLQYLVEFGPGPGFFPWWVAFAMLALSVAYLGLNLLDRRDDSAFPISRQEAGRTIGLFAALTVAVLLMEALGFLLSMALFMFVVLRFFESRGWLYSAVVSAVCSAGVFLLFGVLFEVPLPRAMAGLF